MRELTAERIGDKVKELLLKAALCPGEDVLRAISESIKSERSPLGKNILESLLLNAEAAKETLLPYCQDTGMAVLFLEVGKDVHILGDLEGEINRGVREAYQEGYLRKSVLDPLSRVNTKDNTPGIIHYKIVPGDRVKISAAPKGFGSENMSVLKMLNPSDGLEGIKNLVLEAVKAAGGSACPPVVLGVGIGGSMEKCALLAKEQLFRELGSVNPDKELAMLEEELKSKINALGMGPMSLGGDTYCLAVHIAKYPTHIAALPVAVNFQCHAARHASEVI